MSNTARLGVALRNTVSAALASAVLAMGGPASAQVGVMSAEQLSSLVAQANETGQVRVIVELDMPGRETGLSAEQIDAQRAMIADGQAALARAFGDDAVNRTYVTVPMIALSLTAAQLEQLQSMSGVAAVHLDGLSEPMLNTSTRLTRARRLWRAGLTGEGSVVVALDTGIAYNNRAFRPHKQVIPISACFSTNATNTSTSACWNQRSSQVAPYAAPMPDMSVIGAEHGTHVAATIAASRPRGLLGIAPDAMIIPIQVFSIFEGYVRCGAEDASCLWSFWADEVAALDQVLQWVQAGTFPIAAVNMSLGTGFWPVPCPGDPRAEVIENLRAAGVAVVIASGNSSLSAGVAQPACIEAGVTVGATDDNDRIADFSNQLDGLVDLMAPGVAIEAAYPPTRTGTASLDGTSRAAAHVSGAFALLRPQFPDLTVDQLETALRCTGETVRRAGTEGTFYRIQLQRARSYLVGYGTHPRCP